jgi:hypothetical protein
VWRRGATACGHAAAVSCTVVVGGRGIIVNVVNAVNAVAQRAANSCRLDRGAGHCR